MMKISNWSLKRAGAGITISGVDTETGLVIKLVGVKKVERVKQTDLNGKMIGGKVTIATDAADDQHQLMDY